MTNPQIKIIDLKEYTNLLTPKITAGYQSFCYKCGKSIEETIWVRKLNFKNTGGLRQFKSDNPNRPRHIPVKYYHVECAKRLNMI